MGRPHEGALFFQVNEQRNSAAPNQYFLKIFDYCRDNVVKFAGGEPKEEFGVIHIAEWFAMFWNWMMDPCGTPTVTSNGADTVF